MIVKFSTRHGQLTMLGEPARRLLSLGGHSGTVPGAILSSDLPQFLVRLREGLAMHGDEVSPPLAPIPDDLSSEDEDAPRERPVSLRTRALPVIEMIETALARGSDLMWDRA